MQKIGDSTSTANEAGEFTEGNPAGGVPATQIKAAWLNALQRELLNLITQAGLSQDRADDSQVYKAVMRIVKSAVSFENIGGKPSTLSGYGITDAYTQTQVNNLLAGKAGKATTLSGYGITDAYTRTEVGSLLADKAAKATTLSGYGITDAHTRTEVGNLLAEKATRATTLSGYGITDAYTKSQADNALTGKADKSTTLAGYGITDSYAATMTAGDYNALQKNGHYLLGSSTAANRPPNFNGSWAIRQLEAGYGGILAFDLATDVIAYRRTTPSEYGQWVKIFHTGNFNPDLKADKADVADPWALMPIGVPIPLFLHLHPDGTPPLNKSYRYVSLTASDSYNGGALTGESISGSAPLVSATAIVSLAGSPLNGKTVNLINTEQRLLRGTTVPGQLLQDAMQSISGSVSGLVSGVVSASGALSFVQSGTASTFDGANARGTLTFNAGSVARTADETRVKSIGVVYFMRIK